MRPIDDERRRYPRSKRMLPIIKDADGPGILNHIDNISGNGILCHTIRPVPLMTKVAMVLDLPEPFDRRFECEGIVVRCEPDEKGDDHFKVAILYSNIEDEDRKALADFIEQSLEIPMDE